MLISYLVVLFSLQIFQIPTIKIKAPDRPTLRFLSKTNLRSQHISTIYIEITFIGILCPSSTMQQYIHGTFLKLFSANAQCGLGLIILVEELILCYTFRIASQVGCGWGLRRHYDCIVCPSVTSQPRVGEEPKTKSAVAYIYIH